MGRRKLGDRQWDRIKELIRGKQTDRSVTGRDNRLFVDAVLWIARTGAPWRNLPPELGHWTLGGALPGGREWGCGRAFSRPWPMIPTSNTSSSTPPSCARTNASRRCRRLCRPARSVAFSPALGASPALDDAPLP